MNGIYIYIMLFELKAKIYIYAFFLQKSQSTEEENTIIKKYWNKTKMQ